MKVEFKFPRSIDGITYPRGVYELSNELADHWFLKGLVKCKDVVILEEDPVIEKKALVQEPVKKPKARPRSKPKKKPIQVSEPDLVKGA